MPVFRNTLTVVYENGQLKETYNPGSIDLSQATAGVDTQTVSATSVDTAISFGLTTPKLLILQSLEATTTGGSVTYGPQSSTGATVLSFGTLGPTEVHHLSLNSTTTLRVKRSAAGTTKVLIKAFEL